MREQHYILSIAGFDPSSGAGVTSDVQTFGAHGLYGLSVCTAITVQSDRDFKSCQWVEISLILDQIDTLFERFEIKVVKIGIVPNWRVLLEIVEKLCNKNSEIIIVLDPILKASAGFDFHAEERDEVLEKILSRVTVITPNYEEIKALFPSKSIEETVAFIQERTNIYLKGGHRKYKKGWDALYLYKGSELEIPPGVDIVFEKHGSGCVLSAALASQIALGNPIGEAGVKAKEYIETYLNSNKGLLGFHESVVPREI